MRIMPAVGTHRAMSREEQIRFFGEDVPEEVFLYHDWKGHSPVGTVPGAYCGRVSGQVRRIWCGGEPLWVDGSFDLILSIGQVCGSPCRSHQACPITPRIYWWGWEEGP